MAAIAQSVGYVVCEKNAVKFVQTNVKYSSKESCKFAGNALPRLSHSQLLRARRAVRKNKTSICVSSVAQDASPAKINAEEQYLLKLAVAKKAASLVKPGMIVGIGTGSTACLAIEELGKLKLKDVQAVVTSFQAKVLARQFGVKTIDMNDVNHIDLAIDGADEVDGNMNLIKGGGAAQTLEKVVDTLAKETVIIVDQTKVVSTLGLAFPLPVEVLPQAISAVLRDLVALGGIPEIRPGVNKDGPVMTDLGNMIVDVRFPDGIVDPAAMEQAINNVPGVVDNGLFVNITQKVLVAVKDDEGSTVIELADFVKTLSSGNAN